MIVLDSIDTSVRTARVRDIQIPGSSGTRDLNRVGALVERLGVSDVTLDAGDLEEPADGRLDHRWVYYDDCMHYEAKFPHSIESAPQVAFYSALALATGAPEDESALVQLRLAVYELALNVLEHGRPFQAAPILTVGFRFGEQEVGGWIQDQCEEFNPLLMADHSIGQRLAIRARRGYGIMIVRKLLDSLQHEYSLGNRITYTKRVQV